jgi:Alba
MGRAMNKAVTIAEILKRKMSLHQWNVLTSVEMIDIYEPIEEGLDIVTSRRYVSCMTITLSITLIQPAPTIETASNVPYVLLDANHPGYQPPLPSAEMHPRDFHPSQQQSHQLIPSS